MFLIMSIENFFKTTSSLFSYLYIDPPEAVKYGVNLRRQDPEA